MLECENCPYNICGNIPAPKPIKNDFVVVGMCPTNQDIKTGKPLASRGGKLLNDTLQLTGLPKPAITLALLCKPLDEKKVSKEAVLNCRNRLIEELKIIKPKLVVALGNVAIQSLQNDFKIKITQVLSCAMPWVENKSVTIIPTYHPAKIIRNPGDYKTFLNSFIYAYQLFLGQKPKNPGKTIYAVADSELKAQACSKFLTELPAEAVVSCDIETVGTDPKTAEILVVGFGYAKNKVIIFPQEFLSYVKEILTKSRVKFVYHRSQFDTAILSERLS